MFKLKDIAEPRFDVELPDGTVRSYDPWELAEQLEAIGHSVDSPAAYDGIRKAFGLPTAAGAAAATPPAFTPSRNQCLAMQAELMSFVKETAVSKKLASLAVN